VDAAEKLHHRLLQAQKMEAVGELAGSIAHDFNNLLMVIRSYTDMMLDDPTLSPESTQNARQILAASKRAMNLAGELLAFSRKQDSNPAPTDLNGFLDSAVPMLSRMVGRKINVQVKLSRELWPIRADIAQLEQVLLNLAANARDAMPHGGTLLLETTNVVIEENQASMRKGEYVMMAVSDTGQGIPPEVLPRIFEPFFTTKERGKGTGLGLASVYGIVKHSGGYIWAYSEKGYGTTFKIYIPRLAAAQPTPESTRPLRSFAAATSGS
jgi:signal transduction histidine kinase